MVWQDSRETKYPWWLSLWAVCVVLGLPLGGYFACYTGNSWQSLTFLGLVAFSVPIASKLAHHYDGTG